LERDATNLVIIVFLALLVCLYVVIQILWVKCSYYQIGNKSKSEFTVVQLSDLHGRINFINGSLSSIVNKAKPDYVMITGDLVSKKNQIKNVLKEIQKINCPNIYFVPGNPYTGMNL
jgi:predicted MPP superfamily phosphohydrolase